MSLLKGTQPIAGVGLAGPQGPQGAQGYQGTAGYQGVFWSGTTAEYNAAIQAGTLPTNCLCNITDDVSGLSLTSLLQYITLYSTCSTGSTIAEKAITLTNFSLVTGMTVIVNFSIANTAIAPTLNINSTGAIAIASEDGTICSATNLANFPAGMVEFIYNGTYWCFKRKVVTSYINGTSWYKIWSDGWIEQGGYVSSGSSPNTVTLYTTFSNTNYLINLTQSDNTNLQLYQRVVYNKSTSSFQTNQYNNYFQPYFWKAEGY